jgi:hypothetical protein
MALCRDLIIKAEDILLNRKLPLLAIFPDRLVHPTIGTTADEPNDMIPITHSNFACISPGPAGFDTLYTSKAIGQLVHGNPESRNGHCGEKNSGDKSKDPSVFR